MEKNIDIIIRSLHSVIYYQNTTLQAHAFYKFFANYVKCKPFLSAILKRFLVQLYSYHNSSCNVNMQYCKRDTNYYTANAISTFHKSK